MSPVWEKIAPDAVMGTPISAEIACYRQAENLLGESGGRTLADTTRSTIQQQRKCDAFFQWIPWFSAEQHLLEQRADQRDIDQRKWQRTLVNWQRKIDAERESRQQERDDLRDERIDKRETARDGFARKVHYRELFAFGVVIASATIVSGVLGAVCSAPTVVVNLR